MGFTYRSQKSWDVNCPFSYVLFNPLRDCQLAYTHECLFQNQE